MAGKDGSGQRTQLPALWIPLPSVSLLPHAPFPSTFFSTPLVPLEGMESTWSRAELQTCPFSLSSGSAPLPWLCLVHAGSSSGCCPAAPWWPELAAAAERRLEVQTLLASGVEKKMTLLLATRLSGCARWRQG